ncbi:MAG TPA: CBS domain-containing protein [Vicinamibacterales bacterium]|jgi:CBS domain-containing protein
MTVKELQTSDVKTVSPDTDLAVVARLMWEGDCGAVPVVTEDRKVIGMITDRDICIAAATRAKPPAEIRAGDVITNHGVHAVKPDDDVRVAMRTMRKHKVRRLPVVDREQRLAGIVSINDLAIAASPSQPDSVPAQEFLETFQAICAHEKHAAA